MSKRRAFTLTEMLVVLAILGTLAGIAYPVTRSFVERSREAACLGNLRSLGIALQGYLQEHNNIMPVMQSGRASVRDDLPVLDTVLLPYLGSPAAFQCPADKNEFEKTGASYSWNSYQSGRHVSKLYFFGIREDRIPLISDKEAWHPSGTNFLHADLSSSNKTRFETGSQPP
ncbi:MAG: prepilin-type N-terminal cleavage/methylation domain-containing protein [Akkermansiaceae bacterium]